MKTSPVANNCSNSTIKNYVNVVNPFKGYLLNKNIFFDKVALDV